MNITTIEELKKRIGKFVVLSQVVNDTNCENHSCTIKLLTRVCQNVYKRPITPLHGYQIWGLYTATFKERLGTYTENGRETYTTEVLYARDATEKEIRNFKRKWIRKLYKDGNFFTHPYQEKDVKSV